MDSCTRSDSTRAGDYGEFPLRAEPRKEAIQIFDQSYVPARDGSPAVCLTAGAYGAYVATTWARYGHPSASTPADADPLLDRFMPAYDVVARQRRAIAAPATLAAGTQYGYRYAGRERHPQNP
jgi:hypothetical protein